MEAIAELGVVLLMFTIGLELSLGELKQLRKPVLLGGGLQVGLTVLVTLGVATVFDIPLRDAIFLGFLAALSSTAIVLKAYADRRELQSPQGSLVV